MQMYTIISIIQIQKLKNTRIAQANNTESRKIADALIKAGYTVEVNAGGDINITLKNLKK